MNGLRTLASLALLWAGASCGLGRDARVREDRSPQRDAGFARQQGVSVEGTTGTHPVIAELKKQYRVFPSAFTNGRACRLRQQSPTRSESRVALLRPAVTKRFQRDPDGYRPAPASAVHWQAVPSATVWLPTRANQPFRLRDDQSGATIQVRLVGSRDAEAELAAGYVVYRAAVPGGGHLVHRPSPAGTEDYVLIAAPLTRSVRKCNRPSRPLPPSRR